MSQNKHLTPTAVNNKPIICSGVQKILPKMIGNDFCFKAKEDGKVESIDEKNEVTILVYKNKTKDIIDLKSKLVKNVKSGFFVETKLQLNTKKGSTFKKGDILAYDANFFKPADILSGNPEEIEFCNGCLTKVAMLEEANVFEDSCIVSSDMVDKLKFNVVIDKAISLGANTNISKIVKIGDHIKASDPLITFESSYDEKDAAEVLRRLGDEFGEEIVEIGKNVVKSKISGTIVDMQIFYNHDINDYSPSVKKVIQDFIRINKAREKIANNVSKDTIVSVHGTEQIPYNKVNGEDLDGVMIVFYISHEDIFKCGDKIAFETALKSICSCVVDEKDAPTSEYRPTEHIQAILSPLSFVSRMTTDFYLKLYTNKVMVELKKQCKEIAEL